MSIQWNKVTTFTKWTALVLFVLLPCLAYYIGLQYGIVLGVTQQLMADAAQQASLTPTSSKPSVPMTVTTTVTVVDPTQATYYQNVATWQTDSSDIGKFSIAAPIDFPTDTSYVATQSTDWRVGANQDKGVLALTLTMPKSIEPQTNLDDVKLTVGYSANKTAVADCLTPDEPNMGTTSTMMLDGMPFTVFTSSGAGAGNLYETTSYRGVRAGQCYAIEYTIHSSQIGNYPPEYGLTQFNKPALTAILDRIVGTFTFR